MGNRTPSKVIVSGDKITVLTDSPFKTGPKQLKTSFHDTDSAAEQIFELHGTILKLMDQVEQMRKEVQRYKSGQG